jgi:hypothetical protein
MAIKNVGDTYSFLLLTRSWTISFRPFLLSETLKSEMANFILDGIPWSIVDVDRHMWWEHPMTHDPMKRRDSKMKKIYDIL